MMRISSRINTLVGLSQRLQTQFSPILVQPGSWGLQWSYQFTAGRILENKLHGGLLHRFL